MADKKGQTAADTKPPRYDDAVAEGEQIAGEGVRIKQVPSSGEASAPTKAPVLLISSPLANVDPDDVDRPMRRESPDSLSHQLGDPHFLTPATFDWSRTGNGKLHEYSRCYRAISVIVDLFANDNAAVRAEVVQKRARILAHNQKAKADVANVEKIYQQKLKAAKPGEEGSAARDVANEWRRASYAYRRREGLLPMGYVPILSGKPMPELEPAKKGEVLDLPPAASKEEIPVGGVGVFARYA